MASYGDLAAPAASSSGGGGGGETAALNEAIKKDPELQRLIQKLASGDPSGVTALGVDDPATKISARLKALGLSIPKGSWLSEGEIKKNPNTFLTRALPIMAAVATAGIGLGAMGPGAAFLTGGGGTGAGAGITAAGGGGSAAGGAAAGAGGGGFSHFVSSLFGGPSGLISAGLGAASTYLNNKASGEATEANLKAQQDALKAQIDMYNQQVKVKADTYNNTQQNLAPYQGLGKGAASLAGYGLGIPGYETGNTSIVSPAATHSIDPGTIQYPGSGGSAPPAAAVPRSPGAMVTLRSPDGAETIQVPEAQAGHYLQRGATQVGA